MVFEAQRGRDDIPVRTALAFVATPLRGCPIQKAIGFMPSPACCRCSVPQGALPGERSGPDAIRLDCPTASVPAGRPHGVRRSRGDSCDPDQRQMPGEPFLMTRLADAEAAFAENDRPPGGGSLDRCAAFRPR